MKSWVDNNMLVRMLCFISAIVFLAIYIICAGKPENNLLPGKTFIYTVIMLAALLLASLIISRIAGCLYDHINIYKGLLIAFFGIYPILLFLIGYFLRSTFPTDDYRIVYDTAVQLVTGEDVTEWGYFAYYNNNLGSLVYLTVIFKAAKFIGDIFHCDLMYQTGLIANILSLLFLIVSIIYIISPSLSKPSKKQISGVLLVLFLVLIWGTFWTQVVFLYSDNFSLSYGFLSISLLFAAVRRRNPVYAFLAGCSVMLGYYLKPTVLIPLIAFMIIYILLRKIKFTKNNIKTYIICTSAVLLGLITIFLGFKAATRSYPKELFDKTRNIPTEAFIVMGLNGDGSYSDNETFNQNCRSMQGSEEMIIYSREKLMESLPNLFKAEHIIRKTRHVFGDGCLGLSLCWAYGPDTEKVESTFLWNLLSEKGSNVWKYYCITTAVWFSFLILMCVKAFRLAFARGNMSEENVYFLAAMLSLLGYIIFMTFWEGQAKQFYNQSGVFLMGLSLILNGKTKNL